MLNSATITPTLAAGSTSSPYLFQVNISQRLCYSACVAQTPVFAPVLSLVGYSSVGNNGYMATVNVQGIISYTPCGSNNCCCTKTQVLNQNFTVPFYSSAAPTSVAVGQGTAINSLVSSGCNTCTRSFVSELPMTLTVSTT